MTMTTEERISRLEGIYEQVDSRPSDLTQSFESLRADMNKGFNNLYVLLGAGWITVMGALIVLFLKV